MNKITIKDIARESKVSICTVSKALNNSGHVKKETKEKIKKIVRDFNYIPSHIARAIRTRKTRTIALIIPNFSISFNEIVASIEKTLSDYGYCLNIFNTRQSVDVELKVIDIIEARLIDGIIISAAFGGYQDAGWVKKIKDKKIPTISFDRYISDIGLPYIGVDDFLVGKIAGKYLVSKGHKDFGIITGNKKINIFYERKRGFKEILKNTGTNINLEIEIPGEYHEINNLLEKNKDIFLKKKITAIFCANDLISIYLIKFLQKNNWQVPQDFSVIGFDNILLSSLMNPGLTTIDHGLEKLGKLVAGNLIDLIEKDNFQPKNIIIRPKLIERDSVLKINKQEVI